MSFDRVAPYYDALARLVFGKSIQRAQCHFLNQVPSDARVLIVGGGTGWLLLHLLEKPEVSHITYLETSATMLKLARQKIHRPNQSAAVSIDFILGDESSLPEGSRFSVIITNFLLDMYESAALNNLIHKLATHLLPQGIWLFTDFRLSDQKRHRWWQWLVAQAMYAFFHLTAGIAWQSLPRYHQHFVTQGLRMAYEQPFFADFIVSRVYSRK